MNTTIKCTCGKKALMTHIFSTNKLSYRCAGIPDKKVKRKKIDDPDANTFFCKFYTEASFGPEPVFLDKPKKINIKPVTTDADLIVPLINYFLKIKKFITFQEIELYCKKYNIPVYDNHSETMYEFTQRVLLYFETIQPNKNLSVY
jgi:hypothetical protein